VGVAFCRFVPFAGLFACWFVWRRYAYAALAAFELRMIITSDLLWQLACLLRTIMHCIWVASNWICCWLFAFAIKTMPRLDLAIICLLFRPIMWPIELFGGIDSSIGLLVPQCLALMAAKREGYKATSRSALTINCNISMATTTETVRPWQQLGCIMQPIAAAKKKRESQRNAARTAF